MSPAVECNDLVFLTGFNGMPLKGDLSPDLPEQIREAFMGFRGPNLLRAAVTGERPETFSSAKVSKWRNLDPQLRLMGCRLQAGRRHSL
jgi:hypothetical protein